MADYVLKLTLNQLSTLRACVDATLQEIAAVHEAIGHNKPCETELCRDARSDYIFLDRVLRKIDALIAEEN
jgi:hypothetical protein